MVRRKKSPDARGFAPGEGAGEFFQPSGYVHNVRYLKHMAGSTGARAKGIQIHRNVPEARRRVYGPNEREHPDFRRGEDEMKTAIERERNGLFGG